MVALLALGAVVATAVATPAWGYWTATASASGAASIGVLSPPTAVTVPGGAAANVPVSWTTGVAGVAPHGYFVTRHTGVTVAPACASSPTTLIVGTGCTDMGVPDGTFSYVVTAVYASWTAPSAPSGPVTVENASAVAFVVEPTDTFVNATITPAVTVALRTADGGAFPSSGVTVTMSIGTSPPGGILGGTTAVTTDANGVATFSNLSISVPGVGYTLSATSPGLTADTSATFTISLVGAAQSFSILSGNAVVNTGVSKVSGDVGVSPAGSVAGFPTGAVGGEVHENDAAAAAAQGALVTAYDDLKGRPPDAGINTELGGLTFLPGVYHSTAALALTTVVTLDAASDPNAVFIFQTDAAFDTAASSSVILANGAQAANVFWVVAGAAGTGASAHHIGTILALGAITLGAGTTLIGRALSRGAVTLAGNTIRFTDALPPTITIDGGSPAVTKDTTPTVAGTSNSPESSPVTVRIAGQTLSTTVGSGGMWSVTATALTAGSYEVVAKVRDAAGNGTAVSQVLTVEVNPAPVNLRAAGSYAVLAASFIANTGTTVVNGDLGVNPGAAVTGFPPGIINGGIHRGDSTSAAAQVDLFAAINEVSTRTPHTEIVGDMAGRTFHIGVHHQTAALTLTGTVTLDAEGNPDAIFIFQTDAAFNSAAGSSVILANSAQASNVYWVVDGAAGTGASTSLSGTILARGAITLGAGTALTGRALSRDAVTLDGNMITNPGPVALGRQATKSTVGSDLSVTANVTAPAPTDDTAAPPAENSAATPSAETAPATQMVITTTGVSGTAASTATLGPVTVQARDSLGNPVTAPAGGITVTLSSTSPGTTVFAATPSGTGVTSVVIPADASSVNSYYGDTQAGTPTLTAAGTGLTSATQTATIASEQP